jgi:hypothetical protein
MRRAVERYLEDPMAEEILRGNIKAGDTAKVVAVDGKLSFKVADSAKPKAAKESKDSKESKEEPASPTPKK